MKNKLNHNPLQMENASVSEKFQVTANRGTKNETEICVSSQDDESLINLHLVMHDASKNVSSSACDDTTNKLEMRKLRGKGSIMEPEIDIGSNLNLVQVSFVPSSISSTSPATSSSATSTTVVNSSSSSPPITRSKRNRLNIVTNENLLNSSIISSSNSLNSSGSTKLSGENQSTLMKKDNSLLQSKNNLKVSTANTAQIVTSLCPSSSLSPSSSTSSKCLSMLPLSSLPSSSTAAACNWDESLVSEINCSSSDVIISSDSNTKINNNKNNDNNNYKIKEVNSVDSDIITDFQISENNATTTFSEIDLMPHINDSVGDRLITFPTATNIGLDSDTTNEISACASTAPTSIDKSYDSRKVEPLKINLNRDIVTKKIIYKQMQKSSDVPDEKCHLNEKFLTVSKLTLKSSLLSSTPSSTISSLPTSTSSTNTIVTNNNNNNSNNNNNNSNNNNSAGDTVKSTISLGTGQLYSEAHILPKLTIRASDWCTTSGNCDIKHSVVPRLTIKMDSSPSLNCITKDIGTSLCGRDISTDLCSLSSSPSPSPPPLPKLTIKTSGDIIESKITKHSPRSTPTSCHIIDSMYLPTTATPTIPKFTIKTVPKLSPSSSSSVANDIHVQTIPKLTIKAITSSSDDNCLANENSEDDFVRTTSSTPSRSSSESEIIPKLTFRTIKENSEHPEVGTSIVPKLTIRTNKEQIMTTKAITSQSLSSNANSPQCIPKFTIKTVQDDKASQSIPKLTISLNDYSANVLPLDSNNLPSQCLTTPLFPKKTIKAIECTNSNNNNGANDVEKIPKLTIRQRSTTESDDIEGTPPKKLMIIQESETSNKIPKLMIKQITQDLVNAYDKIVPNLITKQQHQKQGGEDEIERIPKITIKPAQSTNNSDECDRPTKLLFQSIEDVEAVDRIPKITIKSIPNDVDDEKIPKLLIKQLQDDPLNIGGNKVPKLTIRPVPDTDNSKLEIVPSSSSSSSGNNEHLKSEKLIPKITIKQVLLDVGRERQQQQHHLQQQSENISYSTLDETSFTNFFTDRSSKMTTKSLFQDSENVMSQEIVINKQISSKCELEKGNCNEGSTSKIAVGAREQLKQSIFSFPTTKVKAVTTTEREIETKTIAAIAEKITIEAADSNSDIDKIISKFETKELQDSSLSTNESGKLNDNDLTKLPVKWKHTFDDDISNVPESGYSESIDDILLNNRVVDRHIPTDIGETNIVPNLHINQNLKNIEKIPKLTFKRVLESGSLNIVQESMTTPPPKVTTTTLNSSDPDSSHKILVVETSSSAIDSASSSSSFSSSQTTTSTSLLSTTSSNNYTHVKMNVCNNNTMKTIVDSTSPNNNHDSANKFYSATSADNNRDQNVKMIGLKIDNEIIEIDDEDDIEENITINIDRSQNHDNNIQLRTLTSSSSSLLSLPAGVITTKSGSPFSSLTPLTSPSTSLSLSSLMTVPKPSMKPPSSSIKSDALSAQILKLENLTQFIPPKMDLTNTSRIKKSFPITSTNYLTGAILKSTLGMPCLQDVTTSESLDQSNNIIDRTYCDNVNVNKIKVNQIDDDKRTLQQVLINSVNKKCLKRISSSADSGEIQNELLAKKICPPPLIDLTISSGFMRINSNDDSDSKTEILEQSDDDKVSVSENHQRNQLNIVNASIITDDAYFAAAHGKSIYNNHYPENVTKSENNLNVDLKNMFTCIKEQNVDNSTADNIRTVSRNSLENNNRYVDRTETKNLVSEQEMLNNVIYINDETNSDCIILDEYSVNSLAKMENMSPHNNLQKQDNVHKVLMDSSLNISNSEHEIKPAKRPRGRPRKDGQPAGSVRKTDTSNRKFQGVLMVSHNLMIDQAILPSPITPLGKESLTGSEATPNNSTPRRYARRGRGGGRGSGRKRGVVRNNRPRCIGGLLHTPDKVKESSLFSPDRRKSLKTENKRMNSLQVFEEDTRMSAESVCIRSRPAESLNNDDTQSSVLSSISVVEGSVQIKKRAKMEVTAPEGKTDYTVDMIAEYDWPPPKGCCPARNRDTFMIQEQISQYLGIKSFKRKYPDLPRRQIDMEERNYLQEKGLVTEKMCDLGITAVWASDVLDIMCSDFYEKYEEYKDYLRQKQLRDTEAKQKAMAAEAFDRSLQARERAMQSAVKWNSNFNKARKEDRRQCLDLQSFIINVPHTRSKKLDHSTESRNFKPSDYPIALVPGQFSEYHRVYSSEELRCYPINTIIDNSDNLSQHCRSTQDYAEGDSDSKTCWSDDNASSSSDWNTSSEGSDSDSSISSDDDEDDPPDSISKCSVCLQSQNKNALGFPEVFIRCYACRKRIHPSCIEMPPRMVTRVRNYNWQCADCKFCTKCKRKKDESKMLYCEQCDRGYHIYCIRIKNIPEGRWHCEHCAICRLCGSNKPEGNVPPPVLAPNQKPSRYKKAKWTHEYRLDHITKLREHWSTLCVPCARKKSKGCR